MAKCACNEQTHTHTVGKRVPIADTFLCMNFRAKITLTDKYQQQQTTDNIHKVNSVNWTYDKATHRHFGNGKCFSKQLVILWRVPSVFYWQHVVFLELNRRIGMVDVWGNKMRSKWYQPPNVCAFEYTIHSIDSIFTLLFLLLLWLLLLLLQPFFFICLHFLFYLVFSFNVSTYFVCSEVLVEKFQVRIVWLRFFRLWLRVTMNTAPSPEWCHWAWYQTHKQTFTRLLSS